MDTYSIGEISKKFNIPVSTLRYYDDQGLFPDLERRGTIRCFTQREIDALKVITCLKRSGLQIKEIATFMHWCTQGKETYSQRYQLFKQQHAKIVQEREQLQRVEDLLTFKCWYYERLLAGDDEQAAKDTTNSSMPDHIRRAYRNAMGNSNEE